MAIDPMRQLRLLAIVLLSNAAPALACVATLENSTIADVFLPHEGGGSHVLAPGEIGRFTLSESLWLEIGILSYRYEFGEALEVLCSAGSPELEIEGDGKIQEVQSRSHGGPSFRPAEIVDGT